MRVSRLRSTAATSLILLATCVPMAGQPISTTAQADRAASEITTRHLSGVSRTEWRREAPAAAWRDFRGSRDYPPESSRPTHRGLWCSAATDVRGGVTREAVFYALRTELPYECRLEQVRYVFDTAAGDPFDVLAAAFARAWGGNEMTRVPLRDTTRVEMGIALSDTSLTDYRSDEWRDLRYWLAPTRYVYLYRFGTTVQVLVQSYILTGALQADRQWTASDERYGIDLETWNLINRLRPVDPEAVDLILSNEAIPDQELVERVTLRLLRARVGTGRVADKQMFGAALARTADKLRVEGTGPEQARPTLGPLLALGVTMRESEYDKGIWYGSFDPGGKRAPEADGDGTVLYRDVIKIGLTRLRASPTRATPAVLLSLAQAYETWWSLSLAPDDEEFATVDDVTGAADARRQAIKWYDRLLSDFPYSREAERARRVIIQIRLGVDTGQRIYFSPYP